MTAFIKKNLGIILLLLMSIALHFSFLNYPSEVVFDEVYFGTYANNYFTHQYYFDLHPPLGKLLIAGTIKISGLGAGVNLEKIGEMFPGGYFFILRFLPALFGSFLPLIIYLLLLKIGCNKKTAFFGAFLTIIDNTLLTQSKFILLDTFLLVFGFLSLYFFLVQRDEKNLRKRLFFFAISIMLATLALAIKWTGLSFMGFIGLLFLIDTFKKFNFKELFIKLLCIIFIPALVYYSVFLIHFHLVYKSGPGDAFMSTQFQGTLKGTAAMPEWQKFIELNEKMYYYNSTLKATHPYSSKWYQWPLDNKPIWYWTKNAGNNVANIWLFGNPFIWWSVLLGIIFSVAAIFIKKIRGKLPPVFWLLLLGYFANLIPFIFIARTAFLYHYLPSLIFGILILAVLYEKIVAPFLIKRISKKFELACYVGFLCLCLFVFLILSPLSYGFFVPSHSHMNDFYNMFIKFLS